MLCGAKAVGGGTKVRDANAKVGGFGGRNLSFGEMKSTKNHNDDNDIIIKNGDGLFGIKVKSHLEPSDVKVVKLPGTL